MSYDEKDLTFPVDFGTERERRRRRKAMTSKVVSIGGKRPLRILAAVEGAQEPQSLGRLFCGLLRELSVDGWRDVRRVAQDLIRKPGGKRAIGEMALRCCDILDSMAEVEAQRGSKSVQGGKPAETGKPGARRS